MVDYRKIRLIVTSDIHGCWLNQPEKPHVSLLNTGEVIKNLQAKPSDLTLTIDLGDFIQGSSFATYLSQERLDGTVLARGMNYLEYDYQLVGNHEFNFGQNYRDPIIEQLRAKILLSNIVLEGTETPFVGQAYDIVQIDDFKIGLIGTTTSYIPHWELPKNYQGLEFLDAFETTKAYVELIRPQVDLLIVCYHGGFERDLLTGEATEELTKENQGYQMLTEIEGIDILLTGHQHREINQLVGQTWVIQPGSMGEYVGEVEVDISDNKIQSVSGYLHETSQAPQDARLKSIMEPELSQANQWLKSVIGYAPIKSPTSHPLTARVYGHPYLEFLNQVQLRETGADFSAVTLINPLFAEFTGEITQEILLNSYPFYNLIAKVSLKGQELYEMMEFNLEYYQLNASGEISVNPKFLKPKPRHYNLDVYSGIETTIDLRKPMGQRVISLIDERTGLAIDPQADYQVAVTQYRAVGGGDFRWFHESKILSLSQIDIASLIPQALAEFTAADWSWINLNYQHNRWLPAFKVDMMDE